MVYSAVVELVVCIDTTIYRYQSPPPPDPTNGDNHLQASNFENSALFLVSCFQYILVAAVFSIGPPFRKPMWTNGT
jgi:cation-transporting ATPase 13A2